MKYSNTISSALFLCALTASGRVSAQYNKENLKLFKNKVSYADTVYRISNENNGSGASYSWAFGDQGSKIKQELSAEEQKFTFGNLRLYMISSEPEFVKAHRGLGNYTGFKDALAKGTLVVSELQGGTVNTLVFENKGKDTVLVLAGEVVTGGKQDRVVAKDLLLPPNSGPVQVPVFCVEHGRWTPNGNGYTFNNTFGVTSPSVRKAAVVEKNQSQVWSKVAVKNNQAGTGSSTGTYTAIAGSDKINKELPAYLEHFTKLMAEDTGYIGFVAVTGDSIISCDLFANNKMFRQQSANLLKSAAVEAITSGAAVSVTASKVLAFLDELLHEEAKQEQRIQENGTMLKSGGSKLHINYYKK
ncbi:MAG: hypothetical protein KJS92_05310 [Bacteroidetes bacterium]|nr:hypothetical protein [Bacteroidota bacterium]